MTLRKTTILSLLILTLLLLAACSGEGLFYTIQNEVLVQDNNMSNIKFEDVLATNNYYIALGSKIWYRQKSSETWNVLDTPGDSISSMAFFDSKLFYAVRSGNSAQVYSVPIDSGFSRTQEYTSSPVSSEGYVWLQLYSDVPAGNDRIVLNRVAYSSDATTVVASSLHIYDKTGGDSSFGSSVLDLGSYPLTKKGVAFGTGTNMWVISNESTSLSSGGVLYTTTDGSTFTTSSPGSEYYQAISYNSAKDVLLLSTRNDYSNSSASFNLRYCSDILLGTPAWHETGDIDYFISDFSYNGTTLSNYVVAGTISDYLTNPTKTVSGYVFLNVSDTTSISISEESGLLADQDNYESSDLVDSYVYSLKLLSDTTYDTAIAATSTGVWTLSSSSGDWTQE
ncbi:MAG: hypothetical protein JXA95_13590 [Spirochaetales bacterium]|nr:hypothetical protein [Spirochaetales bacterium]